MLTVHRAAGHQDRALAVLQRHQRDAGAGVRDDDVGGPDRCCHLLGRHALPGVDPEAGGVGAAGLPQHLRALRHEGDQPVEEPAEAVAVLRAEAHHHRPHRALDGRGRLVELPRRGEELPVPPRQGAGLAEGRDARHHRERAAGQRGGVQPGRALDVDRLDAAHPRLRQHREGERRAGADDQRHVVVGEEAAARQCVARQRPGVPGRARQRPVDPLPREQRLGLRRAGRHPHHVVAHAEPRPQGVQLHQVAAVVGDEQGGHDRPPATASASTSTTRSCWASVRWGCIGRDRISPAAASATGAVPGPRPRWA